MRNLAILAAIGLLLVAGASALTIQSPTNTTYNTSVPVNITANETQEALSFSIGNYSRTCTNCSVLIDELELGDGDYLLTARATKGNHTVNASRAFSVLTATNQTGNQTNQTPDAYAPINLTIRSPTATTYTGDPLLNITTNKAVDLRYTLNGEDEQACQDCQGYTKALDLEDGNYTLTVFAADENVTVNKTVAFRVLRPQDDDDNQTYAPNRTRYGLGHNKLPKLLEAGEISDAELAAILENEQLNPGTINRLVKTGMLGNQSINAIIDHQETPRGIFGKVMGWFGFHVRTAKDVLAEEYELTVEQEAALVTDDDVSEDTAEKLEERLREKRATPGPAKKQAKAPVVDEESEAGAAEVISPPSGQAKKADAAPGEPPGQAKKSFDAGSQNGRGKAVGKQR